MAAGELDAPFAALAPDDQRAVCMLAAFLRIADVLDREHQNLVRGVSVRLRNGGSNPNDFTVAFTFSLKAWPKYPVGGDAVTPFTLLGS